MITNRLTNIRWHRLCLQTKADKSGGKWACRRIVGCRHMGLIIVGCVI